VGVSTRLPAKLAPMPAGETGTDARGQRGDLVLELHGLATEFGQLAAEELKNRRGRSDGIARYEIHAGGDGAQGAGLVAGHQDLVPIGLALERLLNFRQVFLGEFEAGFHGGVVHLDHGVALLAEVLGDDLLAVVQRRAEDRQQGAHGHHVLGPAGLRDLLGDPVQRQFNAPPATETVVDGHEVGIVDQHAVFSDFLDICVVTTMVHGAKHMDRLGQRARRAVTATELEHGQSATNLCRERPERVDVETTAHDRLGQNFATGNDAFATLAADPDDQILGSHWRTSTRVGFVRSGTGRATSAATSPGCRIELK